MGDQPTPDSVLESTTDQVRQLISEILKLEREYQHYQHLSLLREKETELCDRVIKLIERETKK